MSEPVPAGRPEPGWYRDAPGAGDLRWWDGAAWTEHRRSDAPRPGAVHQPPLPPGTSTNTWMNWVLVLLPALMLPVSLPPLLSFQTFAHEAAILRADPTHPTLPTGLLLSMLTSQLLGLVLMAAIVVLSYFDWKTLRARGIAQPFSWAWSFLSVVYVVGRQVVVHARTGRGLAPLWVFLAGYVVVTLVFLGIFASVFGSISTAVHP